MIREDGWYWCRTKGRPDKLHVFEWCGDYWQVYDMAYDDEDIICLSPRLEPPKET